MDLGIVFSLPKDTPPKVDKIIRNSVAANYGNAAIRPGLFLASINDVPVKPTIDSKELENILAAASTADADSISLDLFNSINGELITVSLPLSWAEKKRRSQEAERLRNERLMSSFKEQEERDMRNSINFDRLAAEAKSKPAQNAGGGKKRTIRKKNRKRTTRTTRANQRKNRRMRKNSRKSRNAQ
jgi:hypothetical protein